MKEQIERLARQLAELSKNNCSMIPDFKGHPESEKYFQGRSEAYADAANMLLELSKKVLDK